MNIFLVLLLTMFLIIILLRLRLPIGPCMLAGGLFIWLCRQAEVNYLIQALGETLALHRTYDIILALYFVMCLEIELRVSGTLTGMVKALQRIFASAKFTLAIMPAFLGLLPSLGGARFSAPIVEEASKGFQLSADHKAAINYWFRHIFEYSSPIIPGMIMACSIAGVAFSDFIIHLCWLTLLAFLVGWFILIRPLRTTQQQVEPTEVQQHWSALSLALAPIIVTFVLVVFGDLNASLAMGLVTLAMYFILRLAHRPVGSRKILLGALDAKMFMNVFLILYFIQILTVTRVLDEIVLAFQSSPLPVPVIIAGISFIIGVLTGMSQGHVAIVMPIVAAMGTGNLNLAGVAMAFGVAGQMLTPTHMCLVFSVEYFKGNFVRTLRPIFWCEVIILTVFSLVSYFTW